MIRKIFTILILIFAILANNAQASSTAAEDAEAPPEAPNRDCYIIGYYQICPSQKAVKVFTMTGGVNWDGYTYVKLDKIDFDNTEMYLIGNVILFKEQMEGKDIRKAHFLHPQKYSLNHPGIPLMAFDNDSIYALGHQSVLPVTSIGDKTVLRDDIFIDSENKLYVLHKHNTGLFPEIPASLGIDKDSIRHLVDNYYYDQSKVYLLDYFSVMEDVGPISHFAMILREHKNNPLQIGASYFIVDDQVYLRSDRGVTPLDLDAAAVEEYLLDSNYMTYLITDSDKVYIHSKHYQGTEFRELTALRGLQLQGIFTGSVIWKYNAKSKLVYLSAPPPSVRSLKAWQGQLLLSRTNLKAFIVDRDGKVLSLNGIMLWNDKPQSLDLALWPKKKALQETTILLGGYNFAEEFHAALTAAFEAQGIDPDKIIRIGESVFYTDGKHLILLDEIWQINQAHGAGGHIYLTRGLDNWVCSADEPDKLKIINNNILTDGKILYYVDTNHIGRKLMATPIADLGIPVFYLEKGSAKITKAVCK